MPQVHQPSLYRSSNVLLLRAAVRAVDDTTASWPDPADSDALRDWLAGMWEDTVLREAVASASPPLASLIDRITAGSQTPERRIVAAAVALTRYVLRSSGRPTPFGLFAGVAAAQFGSRAQVRFGTGHQAAARCDAAWLQSIIECCEACAPLEERLTAVFSSLALARAGRWELPAGPDRQVIRDSPALRALRDISSSPVHVTELVDRLAAHFPGATDRIRQMVTELIRLGFLITNLRPAMTETDALGYVIRQLRAVRAGDIDELAGLLEQLETLHSGLREHNAADPGEQSARRTALIGGITEVSAEGRTPLCLDLQLDAEVTLPNSVGEEMAAAASALIRLSPSPGGSPVWEDYHRRFVERFGTATLVPLLDVIDPGTGLGFPAGYPTSVLPLPPERGGTERHELLAQLITGESEVTLTDETIATITGSLFDPQYIPAHVEIAARIQAESITDIDDGRYTLHISPARAAGTLTSRFTALAEGSGLERVFQTVPAIHEDARTAQLSVPPLYIRGQNIARIPAYLPEVLSLGEYPHAAQRVIKVEDLAVTATLRGLHLVHRVSGHVIEPQVFHPLDLEKQLPPLGRFLAHLPRAFVADYLVFDWGPFRRLPHLPAVRFRRSILSSEQWRLTAESLAPRGTDLAAWMRSLDAWRARTGCPRIVQLHNGDQTLRLDLDEPMHALCLREHLDDGKPAIMTVARGAKDYGWINGHAHEIALPLIRHGDPAPTGIPWRTVLTPAARHGEIPLAERSRWLSGKLFTCPEAMDEILGRYLPALLEKLSADEVWFIRYRNREETDHIRLRFGVDESTQATRAAALATWVEELREQRLCARFSFDTYHPEVGRYGGIESIAAAETVFTADSAAVVAQLRHPQGIDPLALAALGMLDIAAAFCGGMREGAQWLADRRLPSGKSADSGVARSAVAMVRRGQLSSYGTLPAELAEPWRRRAEALAVYRKVLGDDADTTHILESLLHIHHNRYRGIDRDGEQIARRLVRQLALAWRNAHQEALA